MTALARFALALMLFWGSAALAATDGKRVALVIGNSDYKYAPRLPNPINDATAMADKLEAIGFEVLLRTDLDGTGTRVALGEFTEKAQFADVALVFYAGHGIEIQGRNYMIPVDAQMKSDVSARFEAIDLDDLVASATAASKLSMVLLDACRDNPFVTSMQRSDSTRAISRGLSLVDVDRSGLLISFAAQAGTTADDGDGEHSPYTEALLEVLDEPGLEVGRMFRKVRAKVRQSTGGRQVPIERMQLPDEAVYLVPPGAEPPRHEDAAVPPRPSGPSGSGNSGGSGGPAPQEDPLVVFLDAVQSGKREPLEDFVARWPDHPRAEVARSLILEYRETEMWDEVKKADTVGAYRRYLIVYPAGRFADQAEARMAALQAPAEPPKPDPDAMLQIELQAWNDAKSINTIAAYTAYLAVYPDGHFRPLAEAAIAALRAPPASSGSGSGSSGGSSSGGSSGFQEARHPGLRTVCPAQDGDRSVSRIRTNDTLNVRTGPSTKYKIIGELAYNADGVRALQCLSNGWCLVDYGCIHGYASGKFLKKGRGGHTPSPYAGSYRVVDHPMDSKLNVRSGPGTKFGVVAELPPTATGVRVTDCQNVGMRYRWCNLSWGNISGWSYGRYLADARGNKP